MNDTTTSLPIALQEVTRQINEFAQKYDRDSGTVSLLAVSKRKPVSSIQTAIHAGQRSFGENYVDEAVEKIQTLTAEALDWHFIGAIQSRKCQQIAEHLKVTDVHGIEMLFFKMKFSETLTPFSEMMMIFQWQSVGHIVPHCSLSYAKQATSSSSKPAAATRMQAKQLTVEVGVSEHMNTEDRRGEGGRARARL